ncbi:MAG: phosphoribosylamine--glycine ligase, partial [Chloroflexota bacterium]|nr:phosphoribosylamine--glycine ligase [Chloroflexota bacterium]
MKVLIVGSGAREHALAWRLRQSPAVTAIWAASGNGGTAQIATNLNVSPEDVESIPKYAKGLGIDLVVVGPEQPLAAGLVDLLDSQGIPAFGPTKAAAQIEASKTFALDIMRESGVPCPEFHSFQDETLALDFLSKHSAPSVIKADGLAAGKGVFMCHTAEDAAAAVRACMSQKVFGGAGETVVIEEFLEGPEVSVFAFSDGEHLSAPVAACDYKRRSDGDVGPNTGGMGSFAPPDFWNDELAGEITRTIMEPVIQSMARRGTPYRGVLYAGIMLTKQGPKVLEFNCRFGDPETQVIMPLLVSDPLDIMTGCIEGQLADTPVEWSKRNYAGVVMVS